MQLERVIAALAPADVLRRAPVEIRELAYDARAAGPGSLFFCVPGSRADGHDFAPEAVENGAVALVVERPVELDVPQLVVPDARRAMAPVADAFFGQPSQELEIAGVTGTNGKTTTAFLLYSILAAAGRRPGLLGTIECRVGGERRPAIRTTPEAIDLQRDFREMLDAGDRSCALEATSHGSELGRLDRVRFAALVFTNLTQDHLDFHGTLERYFDAKRRLFTETRPPAAVNVGDEHGRLLADELRGQQPLLTYGFADDAELRPESLESGPRGARFQAGGIALETRLRGRFNIENVLGAVAAAQLLDVSDEAIARGVRELRGVPGRFEAVDEGQPFAVLVDYAHTPDSLENVLRTARELARNRLICVFGCGGDRDRGKRPVMGRIAAELADVAIVTSDNPRSEEPDAIIARDRGRRRRRRGGRAGPRGGDRSGARARGRGRRRRDRRQGPRAGPAVPRPDDSVRRPRGRARRAPPARSGGVIALRLDELPPLGELEARADEITGVKVDSRKVEPGDLFVALGRGVDFLAEALAQGAAATLVPEKPFEAMAVLGAAVRDRSSARVVGITGSTGKTSTKDILAALCAPSARTVAAEASYNNEIGVPLTLCRLEPDTEVCILELAMRGFGQIADLCRIARPEIGVITNVGPAHLELVGSLEGVLRAKGELVAALPPGGTAIVPQEFPVERDDIEIVRLSEPDGRRDGDRTVVGGVSFNFTARHQSANAEAALAALDALDSSQARARGRRPLEMARRGVAASRRWPADQRRLQREPRLDARRACLRRRARRLAAAGRDPGRHGGARSRRARVPS